MWPQDIVLGENRDDTQEVGWDQIVESIMLLK